MNPVAPPKGRPVFKLDPAEFIVFYDELDLAPGKLRIKTGGGGAGHNGIRSLDAHLGNNFRRVRIGIGHPGDKSKVTGHVLGNFSKADQDWLTPMLDAISQAAPFLMVDDDNRFASAVAQQLASARPSKPSKPDSPKEEALKPSQQEKQAGNPFADAFQKILGRKN